MFSRQELSKNMQLFRHYVYVGLFLLGFVMGWIMRGSLLRHLAAPAIIVGLGFVAYRFYRRLKARSSP